MPGVVLLQNKDIFGGTIALGTSPDNLLLSAKTARLIQMRQGALDTFYIDPAIGMYKSNANNVEACYMLRKPVGGNSWFNSAKAVNVTYARYYLVTFHELHLSFGNAQPFKMSINVHADKLLDETRTTRLVFECLVANDIYWWIETYDDTQLESTRRITAKRKLHLTWLSAPYLFMCRIYQTLSGYYFEVTDEYSYYTNDTSINEYVRSLNNNGSADSGNLSITIHSRTAGDYQAIRSYGWGIADYEDVVVPLHSTEINESLSSLKINGLIQADTTPGGFSSYIFTPQTRFFNNDEYEMAELTLTQSTHTYPGIVSEYDGGPASHKFFGGEDNQEFLKVDLKEKMVVHLAPGATARWTVKLKKVIKNEQDNRNRKRTN